MSRIAALLFECQFGRKRRGGFTATFILAVIGDLTASDPATDLAIAWMFLPPSAWTTFRQTARPSGETIDDDTWARARGWALADGIAHLASARGNEAMARVAGLTIRAGLEGLKTEDLRARGLEGLKISSPQAFKSSSPFL